MSFSPETLAVAKTYTDETVIGGGAIKGKNCTISSITEITGGHRVTFQWTLDDGTVQTGTMDIMDGQSGGGTGDYADLTNKPSVNGVTLNGSMTTGDLDISYNDLDDKPTIPSTANCYETTDTASDAIDDSDKIPFYNVSVSGKRNMTLSNLKSKLKTYFDNIYSTITTIGALSDVNISSASNGQVLKYDSSTSKWVNANESGGGGGGSAIDYSTVEQDTGIKWVDGSPIYQKTVQATLPDCTTNGTSATVDIAGFSNISILIDTQMCFHSQTVECNLPVFQGDAPANSVRVYYSKTNNALVLKNACKNYNGGSVTITIQYTKTTT
jgi:hypothetical protein